MNVCFNHHATNVPGEPPPVEEKEKKKKGAKKKGGKKKKGKLEAGMAEAQTWGSAVLRMIRCLIEFLDFHSLQAFFVFLLEPQRVPVAHDQVGDWLHPRYGTLYYVKFSSLFEHELITNLLFSTLMSWSTRFQHPFRPCSYGRA